MKPKILILGRTGMLGHMVLKILSEEKSFEIGGTHLVDTEHLFYFDAGAGLEKLDLICEKNRGYDYFINCIGITKDKISDERPKSALQAIRINSIFPQQLAEFAKSKNVRVIHISTDGVFSGAAEFYDEDTPHDCSDIYGKTKSLGEVRSRNFLNIRCSILGPSPFEKRGLFEWFRSEPEGSTINGYTNHHWNGVTTLQFAALCQNIIKKRCFDNILQESHIHHFCPNRAISKYELLIIFKAILGKRIVIVPCQDEKFPVRGILRTKYNSLKNLFGDNKDMQAAINELFKKAALSAK